jgi:hypothetical protein
MHAMTYKARRSRILLGRVYITALFLIIGIMLWNSYRSDGFYSKEINFIGIYPKDFSYMDNLFIASHEVGHYVYFTKLTPQERQEYEKLFKDSNSFIDDYAAISPAESFAEDFAFTFDHSIDLDYLSTSHKRFFINHQKDIYRSGDYNG